MLNKNGAHCYAGLAVGVAVGILAVVIILSVVAFVLHRYS